MVDPYADRHAHQHDWSLEPHVEIDQDVWLRFPCTYWEGKTYTDDARDETYAAPTYECESFKVLVYELTYEVPVEQALDPKEADEFEEAPEEAVVHVHDKREDELREAFVLIDPESPMKGFGKDIDGVRVTAQLRDSYVEEC